MKVKKILTVINGAKVYYQTAGKSTPLIFIHADSLDSRMWNEQLKYFSNKYQVICYDIRGFGKSDLPTNTPYSFHEDLNDFFIHLAIKKAHLVGLSLGGATAIDFTLSYPEKVKSLVLADSGISGDEFSQSFLKGIFKVIKLAKDNKIDAAKKEWLKLDIFSYSRKYPSVWEFIETMVKDTSCYRWFGKNRPLQLEPKAVERLDEIKTQTLILVGEHDIEDFQRKAKLLNTKIKNSRLEIVSDAGHLSNMDNPGEFNQKVYDFLSSVDFP